MHMTIQPDMLKACNELAAEFMPGLHPILSSHCSNKKLEALENVLLNCNFRHFTLHNGALVSKMRSEDLIKEYCRSIRDSMDIHPYKKSREDAIEAVVEKVLTESTITFPL